MDANDVRQIGDGRKGPCGKHVRQLSATVHFDKLQVRFLKTTAVAQTAPISAQTLFHILCNKGAVHAMSMIYSEKKAVSFHRSYILGYS